MSCKFFKKFFTKPEINLILVLDKVRPLNKREIKLIKRSSKRDLFLMIIGRTRSDGKPVTTRAAWYFAKYLIWKAGI
jgi:hypothetical protein